MISVIAYNILAGGTHRVEPLIRMLRPRQPDLISLVEACDEQVVEELAKRLGMQYRLSGRVKKHGLEQGAVLSRLPILRTTTYITPILNKQPLLEVCVQEPEEQAITVFVVHLTANFHQGRKASRRRYQEIDEIVKIMASHRGRPHLLMGDFNSVAPGDRVKGSSLLRFMLDERLYHALLPSRVPGMPTLDYIVPRRLRVLKPALRLIPGNPILSAWLDTLDGLYAPRGGFDVLREAGYVDCFRSLHLHTPGHTWPAALPAGRIDFIFASPEMAGCLCGCEVLSEGEGVSGGQASDHLPVFATFGTRSTTDGVVGKVS